MKSDGRAAADHPWRKKMGQPIKNHRREFEERDKVSAVSWSCPLCGSHEC